MNLEGGVLPDLTACLHFNRAVQFNISEVAEAAGILPTELDLYGAHKAKVHLAVRERLKDVRDG
jgi:formyltetrahydrofolate synthetase